MVVVVYLGSWLFRENSTQDCSTQPTNCGPGTTAQEVPGARANAATGQRVRLLRGHAATQRQGGDQHRDTRDLLHWLVPLIIPTCDPQWVGPNGAS